MTQTCIVVAFWDAIFLHTFTHNFQAIWCILVFYIPNDLSTIGYIPFLLGAACELWLVRYMFKHASRSLCGMTICVYFRRTYDKLRYEPGSKLLLLCTGFGLAACVFCLTMLQQHTLFSHWPREEACMRFQEKANLYVLYRWRSCVKLSRCDCLPCCHSLQSSSPEACKKWMKLHAGEKVFRNSAVTGSQSVHRRWSVRQSSSGKLFKQCS